MQLRVFRPFLCLGMSLFSCLWYLCHKGRALFLSAVRAQHLKALFCVVLGAVGACSLRRAGAGLVGADHNQEPNISCHTCVHPAARHMVAAQNCLQPSRATHSDFYPVQVVNEHLIFFNCGYKCRVYSFLVGFWALAMLSLHNPLLLSCR